MLKWCFSVFSVLLMGVSSLSAAQYSCSRPRCVEQGRVLQRVSSCDQNNNCCNQNNCCNLVGVQLLGWQASVGACPLSAYVGPACNPCCNNSCNTGSCNTGACCSTGCGGGGCCLACGQRPCGCGCCPNRPIFIRRSRCCQCCGAASCPSCRKAPIYDESDQEDVYIPQKNAYWPTKKTDSWMRELQW